MGDLPMTLVDASSWIEFLRGRDSVPGRRVKELLVVGKAAWCEITLVELWKGARGRQEKEILQELENELPLCPINESVWKRARKLALTGRENGLTVPTVDVIVAACAVTHNMELEHCDKHFNDLLPLAKTL